MTRRPGARWAVLVAAAVAVLALGACGDDDEGPIPQTGVQQTSTSSGSASTTSAPASTTTTARTDTTRATTPTTRAPASTTSTAASP